MRTTLDDVARLAGVSRTTASRVLNDKGEVRPEIRTRVKEVIAETGFRPLASARSLVHHRTHLLGVALPLGVRTVFDNSYFGELMTAIGRYSGQAGFSSALFLEEEAGTAGFIDRIVGPGRVDGLIVASYHPHDELLDRLTAVEIPVVTVGPSPLPERFSSVSVDDHAAGREAARHLIARGRTRLGIITGPGDATSATMRTRGFIAGVEEHGHTLSPDRIVRGDYGRASGQRAAAQLLATAPDAVFAESDQMAAGFLDAALRRGIAVPDNIAIVGFDDVPISSESTPTLTTLRQPFDLLAQTAVQALVGEIENTSGVQHHVFTAELIARDSTA